MDETWKGWRILAAPTKDTWKAKVVTVAEFQEARATRAEVLEQIGGTRQHDINAVQQK